MPLRLKLVLVIAAVFLINAANPQNHPAAPALVETQPAAAEPISLLNERVEALAAELVKAERKTSHLEAEGKEMMAEATQALAAANKKLREHEAKIDALLEQNTVLTSHLMEFFTTVEQLSGNDTGNGTTNSTIDSGSEISLHVEATGGVVYIRWGRTSCSGTATVLYEGYGAGGLYNGGGGSDILCAHRTPVWGSPIAGVQGAGGYLYGVEYRFATSNSPFKLTNNGGQALTNNDMPCVACHVQTRTQQIMIPSTKTCPSGWTLEYWGYLASPHNTHARSSFLCLDEIPEAVPGGIASTNSFFLYAVEARCNAALSCPPYIDGHELSCVVCSK